MLKLNNIHVSYASKEIFNHASFEAYEKQMTILIGESGSGKTTLFDCILGKLDHECNYEYCDLKVNECSIKEKETYLLNHISYASQNPTFIADLKMKDQIECLKKIYHSDLNVENLIQLFELEELLECYPNQCSGG